MSTDLFRHAELLLQIVVRVLRFLDGIAGILSLGDVWARHETCGHH